MARFDYLISALCLSLTALVISIAFFFGRMLPLNWSVLLMAGLATGGLAVQSATKLSLLPRLMIVLYAVCFLVTIGHLFDPYYAWWYTPLAVAMIRDRVVSESMLTVGIVGLLGLLAGLHGAQAVIDRRPMTVARNERTLGILVFAGACGLALLLSWMVAPAATILERAYNTGGSASEAAPMNFNAAGLLSYVLIVLLVIDAERDGLPWRRRWKFALTAGLTSFIVIVLQVLRGDRECTGLLAALALLYLTGGQSDDLLRRTAMAWRRIRRVAIPAVAIVVLFVVLGAVRSSLAGPDGRARRSLNSRVINALKENTWTSVLLTNLAQAGQFRKGTAHYLYGETYGDYLLSLPPGILTRAVGIKRPLESDRGPNWWFYGISAGGIHVVVVPFRNFGMAGAFGIMALIGWFIAWVEMRNDRGQFWGRLLFGAMGVVSFSWFWYGDMYLVRILMAVAILGPAYRGWLRFSGELAGREDVRRLQAQADGAGPDAFPVARR
jgi:hypothetical protein